MAELNSSVNPVNFSTTFIALPSVDGASEIKLDMLLAQTTQPENLLATIPAKSTRTRLVDVSPPLTRMLSS